MKQKDKQLMATAYHEAGHFVASLCCGFDVKSVSIVPNEEENTLGGCVTPCPRWFKPEHTADDDSTDDTTEDRTELMIQRRIVVKFAGNEAERKGTGRNNHVGAREDYQSLTALALYACTPEEADAMLKWLRLRAKNLVSTSLNWAGIEGVAQALLERREMTREEAVAAMNEAQDAVVAEQAKRREAASSLTDATQEG